MSPLSLLQKSLADNKAIKTWILGYSGGLDSSVLLHVLASIKNDYPNLNFKCVYVHHGLHENADTWEEHCKNTASTYGIEYECFRITTSCPKGDSVEAWARTERYSFFESLLDDSSALLTAQHQNDQVETFFLNLFRGSGLAGLSAMPESKVLAKGLHIRPFLSVSKTELESYAKQNNLVWIEDDSNEDLRFDRNYLRKKVLPEIILRWPSVEKTIFSTCKRMSEGERLLSELAEQDLALLLNSKGALHLPLFNRLSLARKKNILLHWVKTNNLDVPGERHIEQCLEDLCNDKNEREGCVNWAQTEVRRYKDDLYIMPKIKEPHNTACKWNTLEKKNILAGELMALEIYGKGLAKKYFQNNTCDIRYRKGGETMYVNNTKTSAQVKELLQEFAVLPWWRDHIPLIYIDDEIAQIPGVAINEKYLASEEEEGVLIELKNFELLCQ